MGTTTNTSSTNQYNPASMNAYNAFQPSLMNNWMQMASNPLGSNYFQNQLAQNQRQAAQINQRGISNSLQNMRAGGGILSNSGGFMNAQLQRNSLAGSNMQANAFNSAMGSALNNRNMAMMSMAAYQPLQTGQSSTSSTGGLGTWLPQVAGAALNIAAPGIGSMLGGGSFSGGYGGGGGGAAAVSAPSRIPNPFAGVGSQPPPMDPSVYGGLGGNQNPYFQPY